ncbi:hypothetical protein GCM10010228_58640 [Streptomyces massasporeus]|nr:hypothetical protein GCM10010228_58640 [Streptomyces massasporeus]
MLATVGGRRLVACPLGSSGDAGRAAPTDRLLLGEQVLGDGPDDFRAVLGDPAGIGDPGSGHRGAAAPRDSIHGVGGDAQFQQDRTGSALAGVATSTPTTSRVTSLSLSTRGHVTVGVADRGR